MAHRLWSINVKGVDLEKKKAIDAKSHLYIFLQELQATLYSAQFFYMVEIMAGAKMKENCVQHKPVIMRMHACMLMTYMT